MVLKSLILSFARETGWFMGNENKTVQLLVSSKRVLKAKSTSS